MGFRIIKNSAFSILFIQAIIGFQACSSNKTETNETETLPVAKPLVLDTAINQEYVADIQASQNVELRSRVKGYLDAMYVDEGKLVKQGQSLFSISNQEYQEELLKAKAVLKNAVAEVKKAELELKNVKILVAKNVVSKSELALAQAKLEALQAKVDEATAFESSAKLNLSYTIIKAPFDGIVNRIPNKVGSLIDEGTLLTTISNNKDMYAYFHVSEKEYLALMKENNASQPKTVQLQLADNQKYAYNGIVETVEGEFDKSTGNIAFRARFTNPEQILKHGSSGKILISKQLKNAMIIPQKSTFEVQEKTCVFVVTKDNKIETRSIQTKIRMPHFYVIESGLLADDRFVYEGIQRVKDGDSIVPEIVSLKENGKLSVVK